MTTRRPADELIGERYALGELLGVGGTGSVFAAVDVRGGEDVAIKILHPHLCDDEASRAAFLREAEHVIGLRHPNIVGVHAAGLHDAAGVTMPWIALDRLRGPTLRERVEAGGRLAPADAAAVVDGMLAALGRAHEAGIAHRDLSPQNVVLHGLDDRRPDMPITADMVRVVDFGLADVTGRATLGSDVLLAGTGDAAARGVVGSAAFMSPEQAQGRPVRAVSDLYQAGAVLYYALTARPPFPRPTTEQVMQAHVAAPPPVPSALVPAARPFDRVVTRAMSKTPARRHRDAEELRCAVAEAASLVATAVVPDPGEVEQDAAPTVATRLLAPPGSGDLDYLSPVAPAAAPAPPSRSGAGIAAGAIAVVVLALAGWAVFTASATPADPVAAVTAPAPTETAAAMPTPTAADPPPTTAVPAPAPVTVSVPALHGALAQAQEALRAAGLVLGAVSRVESAEAADRVLSQNPVADAPVAPGTAVDVVVASGGNVVPQVSGMAYDAAYAQLESAGFVVAGARPASPTTAIAAATQPPAGTVLRLGVSVAVVLVPEPTSTPRPTTPAPRPTEESS